MNKFFSILLGISTGILVGLALYPLAILAFDEFYEFTFSLNDPGITKAGIIIAFIIGLYFFICCFISAAVSSYLLKSHESIICRGISIVLCLISILLFVTDSYKMRLTDYIDLLLMLIAIYAGCYLGSKFIMKIKKEK